MTDTTTLDAIEKTVDLPHLIERVWRAVTEPDELARWFPNTSATLDVRPGGEGVFVWDLVGDDGEPQHFETVVRVLMVEAPHRFVWSWGHESTNTTEPVTTVEFLLSPREDDGTTLLVRESGFLDAKHRTGNVEGWDAETSELVAYLG